ncbi:hypothetical protein PPSIR1_41089 [Plesiocystis pacifica SIR-1]|uniref:Right handed beta helix domain-containing protein n=1 Tax=Plesiocystis pacifica SIR-1 TaxID=391625 RepID=A6GIP9_9BACT|nr:hypothetical protein [Plesiocystis pacifica]EDM74237.1 hypothetical protein PPSIR1_41089 [Plesiocystis pacifica SIR-1]
MPKLEHPLSLPLLLSLALVGLSACDEAEALDSDDALGFDDPSEASFRSNPSLPCSGAREASLLGIGLPQGPSEPLPAALQPLTPVDNVDDLELQLLDPMITDIVLDDGVYPAADLDTNYLRLRGKKLWAKNVGGPVFEFGVDAGGNGTSFDGGELHGIVFDVSDPNAMVPYTSKDPDLNPIQALGVVVSWGDATNLVIEDCVIDGNGVAHEGLKMAAPQGLELRRLEVRDVRRHGVQINGPTDDATPSPGPILEHLDISDVRDAVWDRWGVGIWLGEQSLVEHVRVRDVRWAGMVVLEDADQSYLRYIDVDEVGVGATTGSVGVYFDLQSVYVTLENFCVGPDTRIGVNSEWDNLDNDEGLIELPRGMHNVVQNGLVQAHFIGVHFDQGTVDGWVNNLTLRNYSRAGITFHHNIANLGQWPKFNPGPWPANGSVQSANTFQEVPDAVTGLPCQLTFDHFKAVNVTCEPF